MLVFMPSILEKLWNLSVFSRNYGVKTRILAQFYGAFSQFSSVVEQRFCNLSEYFTIQQALDFQRLFRVSWERTLVFVVGNVGKTIPFRKGSPELLAYDSFTLLGPRGVDRPPPKQAKQAPDPFWPTT